MDILWILFIVSALTPLIQTRILEMVRLRHPRRPERRRRRTT